MTSQIHGTRRQRTISTAKALAATLALATLPALAGAPAGRHLQTTELFNFAERQYPSLFPAHAANQTSDPYTYRHYPASGNLVATAGGQVYLVGPATGGAVQVVGAVDDFYCAVVAQECSQGPVALRGRNDMVMLAAGGADSLFLYQTIVNSIAFDMLNTIADKTVSGTPTTPIAGTRALPCVNGGSGTATVTDADNSHTLTPGDRISLVANNCQMLETSGKAVFSGRVDITVASGSNTHNYWASLEQTGGIELRIELRDLSLDWGVLNGSYRWASSWPTTTSDFTVTTSFDDLAATTTAANLRFSDVRMMFTGDSQTLATVTGAITVDSGNLGLGPLRHELSVAKAMVVDQSSIRPRPTSGTLRLAGYGYHIDLGFIGNRTINLTADNGRNGSVDVSMQVTESTLDGQLKR
jgi:hypothetical protein